jgi:hypothetical protein
LRAGPLAGRRSPAQTNNQRKTETNMKRHLSLVASAFLLAGFLSGCVVFEGAAEPVTALEAAEYIFADENKMGGEGGGDAN